MLLPAEAPPPREVHSRLGIMTGRTLKHGDTVRTPDGQNGRILRRSPYSIVRWLDYAYYDLDRKRDVIVYTVLLDSGEVRAYSFDALAAANNPTD